MSLFWLRFATRSLARRRARSGITFGAIALGVGILTFLGAMMVAVGDTMVENTVSLHTGHVLVRSDDARTLVGRWRGTERLPEGIRAALPRLSAPAMLVSEKGAAPVQIMGVVPEREAAAAAVPHTVTSGRYLRSGEEALEIVIGAGTAEALGTGAAGQVAVRFADGTGETAVVAGVFRTGIERFDAGAAYADIEPMAQIAPADVGGDVAVFVRKGISSEEGERLVRPLLAPGETATRWEELTPELEQLTRLNFVAMLIVIVLVVVIMAAGLSNTILVSVMDRYREFGVLKAMGVTPLEVVRLIVTETAVMCVAAGAIGLILGASATLLSGRTGIDLSRFTSMNPHFVMSSVVYPRLTAQMTLAPALSALVLGVAASAWPALTAARRSAAEVMRMSR